MGPVIVRWTRPGKANPPTGRRRLDVGRTPRNASLGVDCWLLTDRDFAPSGAAPPGQYGTAGPRSGVPEQEQTANE